MSNIKTENQEFVNPIINHKREFGKTKQKPVPEAVDFGRLPTAIKEHKSCLLWSYVWDDHRDEWSKVPFQTRAAHAEYRKKWNFRFYRAATTKPKTHSPCAEVQDYYDGWRECFDGVGLVLNNGLLGVDLDNCRDRDTGAIKPWAKSIIDHLNSYTEVSPSGTGVKSFIHASLDEVVVKLGINAKDKPYKIQVEDGEVEVYDESSPRYFTFTGQRLDDQPHEVEQRQEQFAEVYRRVFAPRFGNAKQASARRVQASETRQAAPLDIQDQDLIDLCLTAKNSEKFKRIWSGDLSAYSEDHSRADMALVQHLAFWVGDDSERIDRLFRSSGLYRDKWDREDYRDRTIDRAIGRCEEFFDWSATEKMQLAERQGRVFEDIFARTTPTDQPTASQGDELTRWHRDYSYLWLGNHRRFTDPERSKRAKAVDRVLDMVPSSGFFYENILYQLPSTDCAPIYHLGASLALAGHLLNRKVYLRFGESVIHPNFWVGLLGNSSTARKSTAADAAMRLLVEFDEYRETIMPGGFTFESLLCSLGFMTDSKSTQRQMCSEAERRAEIEGTEFTKGVGIFHLDEIASWLALLQKNHNLGGKEVLTEWYGVPKEWCKETKTQGNYYVWRPCPTILGSSTISWLNSNTQEHDLLGGFLPRWLFFPSQDDRDYILSVPDRGDDVRRARVLASMSKLLERRGEITFDPEGAAFDLYWNWRQRIEVEQGKLKDHAVTSWLNRIAIYTLKIAMVYQMTKVGYEIDTESMRLAITLSDTLIASLKTVLDEVSFEEDGTKVNKLYKFIQAHGVEGVPHHIAADHMKLNRNKFDPLIDTLMDREKIVLIQGPKAANGKYPRWYVAIG